MYDDVYGTDKEYARSILRLPRKKTKKKAVVLKLVSNNGRQDRELVRKKQYEQRG